MKLYLLSSLFLTASYLQNNAVFAQLSDGALQQPSVLSQSTSGDFTIDLSLAEGQHETVAATTFNTRLLGGTLPGPTIRVKKGEWLYVNFSNDLVAQPGSNTAPNEYNYPDSTNLHFHGGHVSGERPGDDTSLIIDAGTSYQYKVFFPQFHMGGTFVCSSVQACSYESDAPMCNAMVFYSIVPHQHFCIFLLIHKR